MSTLIAPKKYARANNPAHNCTTLFGNEYTMTQIEKTRPCTDISCAINRCIIHRTIELLTPKSICMYLQQDDDLNCDTPKQRSPAPGTEVLRLNSFSKEINHMRLKSLHIFIFIIHRHTESFNRTSKDECTFCMLQHL